MHIIVAVVLFVALLYYWLLGHWFARVLVFLALTVLFGLIAMGSADFILESAFVDVRIHGMWYPYTPAWIMLVSVLFGLTIGSVAGWFASLIPAYYWRRRGGPAIPTVRGLWA